MQDIIVLRNNLSELSDAFVYIKNIIEESYGPLGKKVVMIEKETSPFSTNDGYTILKNLRSEDKYVVIARNILMNSASKINTEVGDGTSTSILLSANLISEFLKLLNSLYKTNQDPRLLQWVRDIDSIECQILALLKDKSIKSLTKDTIHKVAKTAVREEYLAKMVSEFIHKLGKNGMPTLAYDTKLEYEVYQNSFYIEGKLPKVDYFSDKVNLKTEIKNPLVILINASIDDNNFPKLQNMVSSLAPLKRDIVLITQEQSDQFIRYCDKSLKQDVKVYPVLAPHVAEKTNTTFGDMEVLLDCECINPGKGKPFDIFDRNTHLGKTDLVTLDKSKVIFSKIKPNKKSLKDRREQVEILLKDRTMRGVHDFLIERKTMLATRFGIFYVSGKTDMETTDMYTRIEDGIRSCQSAMREGLLEGAGVPLYDISNNIALYESSDHGKRIEEIFYNYCQYQSKLIHRHLQLDSEYDIEEIRKIVKGKVYDTYESVEKTIESSISLLKQVLLTNIIMYDTDKDTSDQR